MVFNFFSRSSPKPPSPYAKEISADQQTEIITVLKEITWLQETTTVYDFTMQLHQKEWYLKHGREAYPPDMEVIITLMDALTSILSHDNFSLSYIKSSIDCGYSRQKFHMEHLEVLLARYRDDTLKNFIIEITSLTTPGRWKEWYKLQIAKGKDLTWWKKMEHHRSMLNEKERVEDPKIVLLREFVGDAKAVDDLHRKLFKYHYLVDRLPK